MGTYLERRYLCATTLIAIKHSGKIRENSQEENMIYGDVKSNVNTKNLQPNTKDDGDRQIVFLDFFFQPFIFYFIPE